MQHAKPQNGYTYRKKESCPILAEYFLYQTRENRQGTVDIFWCIWCKFKFDSQRASSVNRPVLVAETAYHWRLMADVRVCFSDCLL